MSGSLNSSRQMEHLRSAGGGSAKTTTSSSSGGDDDDAALMAAARATSGFPQGSSARVPALRRHHQIDLVIVPKPT